MSPNQVKADTGLAMKPRRRWCRWWRGLLVGLLAVVIGGWCARFWLGERLAGALQAELAARGFHVSWKSAAFFPGRGISFEDFQLHRDARRTASLMAWDQVTVHMGSAGWKSLRLHTADSELVVGEGADSLRMTNLTMDLEADSEGVAVKNWNGLAHGLRVDVEGSVLFAKLDALREKEPEAREKPADKDFGDADLRFLRHVGEWMNSRQTGKKEVHLTVRFQEREAAPGYLLRADLDGADFEWRGQYFPMLGITMEWPMTGKPEPIQITRLMTSPEEQGQKLALTVDLAEKELRVNAESAVLHLAPVLAAVVPSLADDLKAIRFDQASHWRVAGVIPWGGSKNINLSGQVSMAGSMGIAPGANTQIQVTGLQTAFDLHGQTLELRDLLAKLWGGWVRIAEAQVDLKTSAWVVKEAQVKDIQLPQVNRSLGWKNSLTGVIDGSWLGRGGRTLSSVRAEGSARIANAVFPLPSLGGLRQTSGENPQIEFKELQAGFALHDQTLVLKDTQGGLWGGRMQIDNAIMNFGKSTWIANGAKIEEVQIPLMRRGLGLPDKDQQGTLYVAWQGGGGMGLTSIAGAGALRVTDEGFNKLPLLGPMSLVFVGIAPGFAGETTSRLATDYALRGGTLKLSNLKADSEITEIQAEGDLNLVTQHAKLTARAKLRGIAGLPTAVLGRLLTLDGEGPFSDIQWRLRFALGMESVAGVAGIAGDIVRNAGELGVGTATDAVKGVGIATKGILGIPGRLLRHEDKQKDQQKDKQTPTKPTK